MRKNHIDKINEWIGTSFYSGSRIVREFTGEDFGKLPEENRRELGLRTLKRESIHIPERTEKCQGS